MKFLRSLRPLVITPNAPASWASVSQIQPEFFRFLKTYFKNVDTHDAFSSRPPAKHHDLWIFPAGVVQTYTLNWLREKYPNPLSRPKGIFLLGGEGAKLGYHLCHYRDVFRPDDQWVVSCDAEKELLDDLFPNNKRTHLMFHPVASSFRPLLNAAQKMKLRKKLGLPTNQKLILYAGRISQQKNVTHLLRVLKENPKSKLIICGDADSLGVPHIVGAKTEHVPYAMAHAIQQLRLSPQIEFRPFQSQEKLRLIMQACDQQISLSAHYGEDFGYSIAQGLHCGLSTVLSSWGGHRNWMTPDLKKQVSYIELDWSNHREVGIPAWKTKLRFPKGQGTQTFAKDYQATLKAQFDSVMQVLFGQAHFEPAPIQVRKELVEFWEGVRKAPRAGMYPSTKHPLFQKVIRAYSGGEPTEAN